MINDLLFITYILIFEIIFVTLLTIGLFVALVVTAKRLDKSKDASLHNYDR